jgi:hypothetical protein
MRFTLNVLGGKIELDMSLDAEGRFVVTGVDTPVRCVFEEDPRLPDANRLLAEISYWAAADAKVAEKMGLRPRDI